MLKTLYVPQPPLNADAVTETGFCPSIHKHTLILRNPSLSALIVLGTAGLFVLLICLSQRLVELPLFPHPHHPSSSFSNRWAKPSISLLRGAFVITPTHLRFARSPKSSRGTCVVCARTLVFRATLKGQHFPCLLQVTLQSVSSTDCTSYIPREIQDIRTNTWQGNLLGFFCFLFNPTEKNKHKTDMFAVSNNFVFALEARSQCIPQKCLKSETREE